MKTKNLQGHGIHIPKPKTKTLVPLALIISKIR